MTRHQARRDLELDAVVDLAALALLYPHVPRLPSSVRTWETRGRIVSRGKDWRGRNLYSVRDVAALIEETDAERLRRAQRPSRGDGS